MNKTKNIALILKKHKLRFYYDKNISPHILIDHIEFNDYKFIIDYNPINEQYYLYIHYLSAFVEIDMIFIERQIRLLNIVDKINRYC
jgi:hypothetical protein